MSAGEAETVLKTAGLHGKDWGMTEQQRKRYRHNYQDDGTSVAKHKHRNAKGNGKRRTIRNTCGGQSCHSERHKADDYPDCAEPTSMAHTISRSVCVISARITHESIKLAVI